MHGAPLAATTQLRLRDDAKHTHPVAMRLVPAGQRPLVHATPAAAATAAAASLLTAGRAVALALATAATTAMRLEQSCDAPRAQSALLVGREEQTGGQVRSDTRDRQPKRKTLEAGGQARAGVGGGGGGGGGACGRGHGSVGREVAPPPQHLAPTAPDVSKQELAAREARHSIGAAGGELGGQQEQGGHLHPHGRARGVVANGVHVVQHPHLCA